MSKICTTIEQSQKLIELGIDRNTADMCWQNNIFPIGFNDEDAVPAWSLSALLELMPTCVLSVFNKTDGHLYRVVKDTDERKETEYHRNSIDAAFVMVCWLKKNNKL